jgi:hypothetical protein
MIMKRPLVLTVAVAALAAVVVVWLFVLSDQEAPGASVAPVAATSIEDASASAVEMSGELDEPGETGLAAVEKGVTRVVEHVPEQARPTAPGESWLAGRVQFPAGTPTDERVIVLAVDRPRNLGELVASPDLVGMAWDPERHRANALLSTAEVAPDGTFRLELPIGTETAHLAVTGRYLFSMATVAVTLPAGESTTLTGELGAWVTGTLLPPPEASPLQSDFEWIELELGPDITAGFDTGRMDLLGVTRKAEASANGNFEFRGVPGAGGYGISVEHGHLAAALELGIDPQPGERLRLDLQMTRGATLRGHVVDDVGAPLLDAEVEARWRGALGDAVGSLRETVTEEDGSFELLHVALGKVDLVASREGRLQARHKVETELADGAELNGLTVVLGQGAALTGWVTFPDGAPAEGVEVRAGPDLSQLGGMNAMDIVRTRGGTATTDAEGHFALTGLTASKFQLTAELHREEGEHAGRWKATEKSVEPGGEVTRLILAGLVPLRGRVVDLEGAPVGEFVVRMTLQGSGAMFGIGAERRSEAFEESEDGSFVVEGLSPSLWETQIKADGFARSDVREVQLPQIDGAPELLFTLEPSAAVAGRVVDTGDAPVAGARVALDLDIGTRMEAMQGDGVPEVFTDVDGEFLMEGLDPGAISLVASFEGFASSEPVPSQIVSGEVTGEVLLRLRVGGTLTGIVYDDAGDPAAGRMVIAQHPPSYTSQHLLTSDERGEFRVEHLEPGTWQVIATENFMSGDSSLTEDDADMSTFLGSMKMSAAEIVDGEQTHVVLGAPPADPVQLHGRVTHAGEPVAGAMVSLVPEGVAGLNAMSGMKMKITDGAGAFDVQLDQPGAYLLTVQTGVSVGNQNSVEYLEHVPEGSEEHALEIELPGGRISGLVRGPDGAPLPECRVTVNVDGGVAYGSLMGGNYVEIQTDAEGRYDADYLRAGTYTVAAGGVPLGGLLGGVSKGGRRVLAGVRLSDGQWLESVDFRLEEPAELTGTVLDPSGTPVSGASVFVRDDAGQLLERFSLATTDGAGRFTYPGLAPGRYQVSARKSDQVSEESAPVSVAAGGSANVSVTLLDGTVLRIAVVDRTGAELEATVSVVDSEGREVSGMLSMSDVMERVGESFSSEEHRVGPLADGKYTVTATQADGRTKTRSVQVNGQGERKVKLRLD